MEMTSLSAQCDATREERPLRILFVEDFAPDRELAERSLRAEGMSFVSLCVEEEAPFLAALDDFHPDLVISDYALPTFDGMRALRLSMERKPNLPFIIVTGSSNEETAVACMKAGATDYVIKEHVRRLPFAVQEALLQKTTRSAREEAERALRESEAKFRALAESTPTAILLYQKDKWVYANPAAEKMCGYSLKELEAMHFWDFVHGDHRDLVRQRGQRRQKGEKAIHRYEFKIICKDGREKWADVSASSATLDGEPAGVISAVDITDRKEAEAAIRKAEEKYRSIFENAAEGIFQATPEGRFITGNPALARIHGYDSPEELINDIADINTEIYVNPVERRAYIDLLRTKEAVHEFTAEIFRKDGRRIWVSVRVRGVRDDKGDLTYIEGIVEDVTERKRSEERLRQTLQNLRKAVETTVRTLASAVEARDPYTAGHQQRVADLAHAIATELGLPQEVIEGIRMAALIHDIGKISVPAEILSKPARLTPIEYQIVKVHAENGHDILRDVESPWPLAEIVLQHHERIDGTGYPKGLKDGEIILEARIIAVADVVESMASFRPYRPALGIEAALEEVQKNKGILYDREASDACLRLFRDKGFRFR